MSLALQVDYPEIAEGITPRHRFMSAYEQRIEPPDKSWQYLLFAAEPYETIAFKVCHSLQFECNFNFRLGSTVCLLLSVYCYSTFTYSVPMDSE